MTLKENQRLVCAGQMPIRAPDGKQLAAVPVYKIAPADCPNAETLKLGERLTFVGIEESKETAEERYNALISGETPPKPHATPLYIKESSNDSSGDSGLSEGEKAVLNPLIAELMGSFSAAMREREALERQRKAVQNEQKG